MTQTEAAQELRTLADKLAANARHLTLPREQYTLAEAHATLRAAIPKMKPVNIELDTWDHGFTDGITTEWKVYDGTSSYRAATLSEAVNLCLAANREPRSEPLSVAEGILAEARDDDAVRVGEPDDLSAAPATTVLA